MDWFLILWFGSQSGHTAKTANTDEKQCVGTIHAAGALCEDGQMLAKLYDPSVIGPH
jgi:hypothetical protein